MVRKINKKILSVILILLVFSLISQGEAQANIGYHPDLGEDVIVGKNEVLEGPYLKTGNNIVVSGTINGDAYLLGGLVTVDGTINGDLIVGGGMVTIKGKVAHDVRAVSGLVTIDGRVGGNVTALGGTINIGSDADIDGGVLAAGGNLAHLGNIDGNAQIYADQTTLAGRVGGNIRGTVSQLTVAKTAILDGTLAYTSDKEASVSAEAKIAGFIRRIPTGKALTARPRWGFNLLSYFGLLLLGIVLLKFMPKRVTATSQLIGKQPWRVLGWGGLTLALTPLAVVLLVICLIGVPLAVVLAVAYILMLWWSSLFTGLFVGQKFFDIANLKENRYAMLAVGLLLLQLAQTLPVIGVLIRLLSVTAAMGAMVISKHEALKKLEAGR